MSEGAFVLEYYQMRMGGDEMQEDWVCARERGPQVMLNNRHQSYYATPPILPCLANTNIVLAQLFAGCRMVATEHCGCDRRISAARLRYTAANIGRRH